MVSAGLAEEPEGQFVIFGLFFRIGVPCPAAGCPKVDSDLRVFDLLAGACSDNAASAYYLLLQ